MSNTCFRSLAGALVFGLVAVFTGPIAQAQVVQKETTEKTTTYSGTVSEILPSTNTIIIRSESATTPTKYTYTKQTTFVDSDGNVVSQETVKGNPVTVYYTKEGDAMVVEKV
ncbi:MAG: hypothetical protein ACXWDK_10340, partial [Aeromicrobium sp.]